MILYIFTKISVDLYSGAIFIQQALRWNLYLSIFAVLGLTVLCTLGGGLAAVIYIDVVQFLIMITGSSILLYLGLDKVGVLRLKHSGSRYFLFLSQIFLSQVGGWGELQEKYMTAVANVTYVSPDTGAACGLPRGDAWTILREAATSDMPWPGFLLGQTPASIWYWCADQMMVQKAGLIRKNDRQSRRSAKWGGLQLSRRLPAKLKSPTSNTPQFTLAQPS